MASITKRNSGFTVRWREFPGGRGSVERRRQVPTHALAKQLVREIEAAHALGRRWEPQATHAEPSIEEMVQAYQRDRRRVLRARTLESVAVSLSVFVAWADSRQRRHARASDLSKALLSDFWTHCTATRKNAPATANMRIRHVAAFWAWCWDEDDWEGHVPRPRSIDLPAIVQPETRAPTWAETDRAIHHARGWYRKLLVLGRCTGLRRSQLMRLRWSDVDLEARTLRVRPELGKSRQERTGRTVPLAPVLVNELAGWGMRDGLLVGTRTKRPDWEALRRVWRLAKVPEEVRSQPLHCLRKGFISGLIALGANREAVEYLVGHDQGIRGVYTDPAALPLVETVALVPAVAVVVDLESKRQGTG